MPRRHGTCPSPPLSFSPTPTLTAIQLAAEQTFADLIAIIHSRKSFAFDRVEPLLERPCWSPRAGRTRKQQHMYRARPLTCPKGSEQLAVEVMGTVDTASVGVSVAFFLLYCCLIKATRVTSDVHSAPRPFLAVHALLLKAAVV